MASGYEPTREDDPIFKIEMQIEEVERQLKEVVEQLGVATGPDRDYIRKKKWLLRKEEQQLREKELIILKSKLSVAPSVHGIQEVLYKCDQFWETVAEAIPKMAKPQDFKQSYVRCGRKKICAIQGYPSLLWDGLETTPFQLAGLIEETRCDCCVILDAPGAGKTRSLYELAAAEPCLFFTMNEGSADILEVCSALLRLFPQGYISRTAIVCCVGAMVLCRLYLLQRSREAIPGFSHATWLFNQVAFKYLGYPVTDPFRALTRNVLELMQNSTIISGLSTMMMVEITRLRHETGVRTLILDESQLVDELLVGRFDELFNVNKDSSFLYVLIDTFYSFGFQKVYISGTGHRFFSMVGRLSMSPKMLTPKTPVCRFHLTGFGSPQQLEDYTRLYITDTSDFDFSWLWSLYGGRHRFYITALERFIYLSEDHVGLVASDFMYSFARDLVTQSGNDLKLPTGRSIRDQVASFFAKHRGERVGELVEWLVVLYFFGGTGALFRSQDLRLVDCGLARLAGKRGSYGRVERLSLSDFEQLGCYTLVQMAEPLVCWAMWEYVSSHPEEFKEFQVESLLENEVVTATSLGDLFDGRKPVDVVRPSTGWTHNIMGTPAYSVGWRLCRPRLQYGPVIQSVSRLPDGTVGLLQWFGMIMSGAPYFPTYLHTGSVQCFGPDLLFLLKAEWGTRKRYLPVFCQFRTEEQSKKMISAWNSLDVDMLYLHGNTQRRTPAQDSEVEMLNRMCGNVGCIKLVVVNVDVGQGQDLGQDFLYKKLEDEEMVKVYLREVEQEEQGGVPPLLGVIDGHNIYTSEAFVM